MRKSKYRAIGRVGMPDYFLRELQKAAGSENYSSHRAIDALIDGAIEDFHAGRPQNIQAAFQSRNAVEFHKTNFGPHHYMYFVDQTLNKLSEKSNDVQAVIDLALATASGRDKQEILGHALMAAAGFRSETFTVSLLKSGADANAKPEGEAYSILARAIEENCSPLIIKALCDHGARFDEARRIIEGFNPSAIDRLNFYEEALAGKPGVIEVKEDIWQQMQEQIADLTQELARAGIRSG